MNGALCRTRVPHDAGWPSGQAWKNATLFSWAARWAVGSLSIWQPRMVPAAWCSPAHSHRFPTLENTICRFYRLAY